MTNWFGQFLWNLLQLESETELIRRFLKQLPLFDPDKPKKWEEQLNYD